MTKQNYEQVAKMIRRLKEDTREIGTTVEYEKGWTDALIEFTRLFADYASKDNERFDSDRFFIATGWKLK